MIHEYFPEELLLLQEEVAKHPSLLMLFQAQPDADLGERIAHVCHYVGWPIDSVLDEYAVRSLATQLTDKLFEMRTSIILTH